MRMLNTLACITASVFLLGCRTVNTTSANQTITTDPMLSRYVSVLRINESVLGFYTRLIGTTLRGFLSKARQIFIFQTK